MSLHLQIVLEHDCLLSCQVLSLLQFSVGFDWNFRTVPSFFFTFLFSRLFFLMKLICRRLIQPFFAHFSAVRVSVRRPPSRYGSAPSAAVPALHGYLVFLPSFLLHVPILFPKRQWQPHHRCHLVFKLHLSFFLNDNGPLE